MDALSLGPASAAEVSEFLRISDSKTRYEIERLLDRGALKVAATRPRRGTVERLFAVDYGRSVERPEALSGERRVAAERVGDWIVRKIYGEAVGSIGDRERQALDDIVTARIPMSIDVRGFDVNSGLIEAALGELIALAEGGGSTKADPPPSRVTISGLFLLEIAPC